MMIKSITIDSKEYIVSKQTEKDENGNESEYILLKSGQIEHRLSPATTEEELKNYADPNNKGHTL